MSGHSGLLLKPRQSKYCGWSGLFKWNWGLRRGWLLRRDISAEMWSDRLITDSQFLPPRKYHRPGSVFVFSSYLPSLCLPVDIHFLSLDMLVHPTASPPLYISCMGFFNLFISYIVSTCAWTDYSGLIISHTHTCSSFCFVLIYHILLDLSHFANDIKLPGLRGKSGDFWGPRSHMWFVYGCMCTLM